MRRLSLAAEKGDADAQFNLGVLYDNRTDDNGYAISGNRALAMKWLLAAAQQGLPRAQIKLAEMYNDGPDSDGRHAEACFWFLVAKADLTGANLERARSGYEHVSRDLSPAQIAAAVKRAQIWKPTRSAAPVLQERNRRASS